MEATTQLFANRYELLHRLGQGGMGSVFAAHDRLTGQRVALKRVQVMRQLVAAASPDHTAAADPNLTLAHEFSTLASLRHPNIISVLDYGFDHEGKPFFTMHLIDPARDILEAGRDAPLVQQADLLAQTLHALEYLHRRQIIHRDVKPSNVLVTPDGSVKLLDFGLSTTMETAAGRAGTIAYMPPETLGHDVATRMSDQYSVGVIAYEMLVGKLPFDPTNIKGILTQSPDFSPLQDHPLCPVLDRLLAKDPAGRYPSARAAMLALCAAAAIPVPDEAGDVRESYLQAARFVGRTPELTQLEAALIEARDGQGSVWIVAGESGVGKSRLLNEVAVRAMVRGWRVLRGQAEEHSHAPFQVWVEPIRQLALTTALSDFEVGILQTIVPNMDELLGRSVETPDALDARQQRLRLERVVGAVFERQQHRTLLLLEDLHWMDEGFDLLQRVALATTTRPLVVIGSHRMEEAPTLARRITGSQVIALERLRLPEIAELVRTMTGIPDPGDDLLNLLLRETEGNIFFVVETIRALAQKLGSLGDLRDAPLPQKLTVGGVLDVVRRRLSLVPAWGQPLLKMAAVYGRQLDFAVLRWARFAEDPDDQGASFNTITLDHWLQTCIDANVIEYADGHWRFAHDKFRETLLDDLDPDERPALHRRVALGIERAHPHDEQFATALMNHWQVAGDIERYAAYTRLSVEANLRVVNVKTLEARLMAALDAVVHLPEDNARPHRVALANLLADVLEMQGDYPAALRYAEEALREAETSDDQASVAHALTTLAHLCERLSLHERAVEYGFRSLNLARQRNDSRREARSLLILGSVLLNQGHYASAHDNFLRSLILYHGLHDLRGQGFAFNRLGRVADAQGDRDRAGDFYRRSLKIFREIEDRDGEARELNNLGTLAHEVGEWSAARGYYERSLALFREVNNRWGEAIALGNIGSVLFRLGDLATARLYLEDAYDLYRETGSQREQISVLGTLSRVSIEEGKPERALALAHLGLDIARSIGSDGSFIVAVAGVLWAHAFAGHPPADLNARFLDAIQRARAPQNRSTLRTFVIAGAAYLLAQHPQQAAKWLGAVLVAPDVNALHSYSIDRLMPLLRERLGLDLLESSLSRGMATDVNGALLEMAALVMPSQA